MIILIDDAFCELDKDRVNKIIPVLKNRGQMFITSTTPDINYAENMERMNIVNGAVCA
jgi:recombinational DNA repair ATPase RecF